jgi:hypothetical protein
MSAPTDDECDALAWEILAMGRPESSRDMVRWFAREMQARGVEHAAACSGPGPRAYLLREAARIREGHHG